MWYGVQVTAAVFVLGASVVACWWVAWRLILSKYQFFQEIFGVRSPRAMEQAALKKKKQQAANTFVLTRSGEQAARRRESVMAAAHSRASVPTSTPLSAHTPELTYTQPATPVPASSVASRVGASSSGLSTPDLERQAALHARATAVARAAERANVVAALGGTGHSAMSLESSLSDLRASSVSGVGSLPSHLPTDNRGAAALAAEALHRRRMAMGSDISSVAPSSATGSSSASSARGSVIGGHAQPVTLSGSGWLRSAAIIEDYVAPAQQRE
jgi:hypothetical protein